MYYAGESTTILGEPLYQISHAITWLIFLVIVNEFALSDMTIFFCVGDRLVMADMQIEEPSIFMTICELCDFGEHFVSSMKINEFNVQ